MDVETTILLLVVGVGVTELAVRGRRSRVLAATDERFLDAIQSTGSMVASGAGPTEMTAHVAARVRELLGLRGCRFEAARFGGIPRLLPDGRVRVGNTYWDVEEYGLPDQDVELLVSVRGSPQGRLVLTPEPGVVPTLPARRCTTVLAEQLAGGLAGVRQPVR